MPAALPLVFRPLPGAQFHERASAVVRQTLSPEIRSIDLRDRIADLADQLAALAAAVDIDSPPQHGIGSLNLRRLLQGTGNDNDLALLAVGPVGCRVAVVHCADAKVMTHVVRRLDQVRNSNWTALGPTETAVLVAEYPRRATGPYPSAAASLADTLARTDVAVHVGISSPVACSSALPMASQEAQEASDVARETGLRWLAADAHWAELGTRRLRRSLADALTLDNPLLRLRSYDDAQGTAFLPSVVAWVRANGDTSAAATRLGVHTNTLRYRIRRAQEISGLSLDQPEARLLALLFGD